MGSIPFTSQLFNFLGWGENRLARQRLPETLLLPQPVASFDESLSLDFTRLPSSLLCFSVYLLPSARGGGPCLATLWTSFGCQRELTQRQHITRRETTGTRLRVCIYSLCERGGSAAAQVGMFLLSFFLSFFLLLFPPVLAIVRMTLERERGFFRADKKKRKNTKVRDNSCITALSSSIHQAANAAHARGGARSQTCWRMVK